MNLGLNDQVSLLGEALRSKLWFIGSFHSVRRIPLFQIEAAPSLPSGEKMMEMEQEWIHGGCMVGL